MGTSWTVTPSWRHSLGGDMDMSPEEREALWDDVYEYARFKAEQWRKKKDQE